MESGPGVRVVVVDSDLILYGEWLCAASYIAQEIVILACECESPSYVQQLYTQNLHTCMQFASASRPVREVYEDDTTEWCFSEPVPRKNDEQ